MTAALVIVSIIAIIGWWRAAHWKNIVEIHEWCEWAKDKDFSKVHYAGKD